MVESTVLIIDDDPDIVKVLEGHLNQHGYRVFVANNGLEGWAILQQEQIDLGLVDLIMPVMDGMTLIKKCQYAKIQTPLVVLTGHGTIETTVQAVQMGVLDVIQKPIVNYTEFITNIAKAISPSDEWAYRLNTFFEQHYLDKSLCVDDMLTHFHYSKSHLSSLLKKHLRMTFIEKLHELRLTRAQQLMRDTGLTLSEISDQCGFGSLSYFSRIFNQKFGCSPRKWRNREQ